MIKGFREFLLRGNVVDLAVAVVIGAAFGAVVTALVNDLLTPLIAAIGGNTQFDALKFTINGSDFRYGDFINKIISFVITAAAIYFFVVLPIKKLTELRRARMAAGQQPETAALPSDELVALHEIRDLLARQEGTSTPRA